MQKYIVDNFRMFAPVRIGAISGYAQVDTGVNPSFIRQSFSKGFRRVGTGKIKGAVGMAAVEQCKLDVVSFLGHDFPEVVVSIQPDDAGEFQSLPFQVVMTAGVDILYYKLLCLDFTEERIGFLDIIPLEWKACSQVIDLRFKSGLAFFKINLGTCRLNALFDIGAGLSVLNTRCLDMLRVDLTEQEPEETFDPTGAKALIPVYKHSSLEIDGCSVGEIRFLVIDLTSAEKVIGEEIDLILGFDTMLSHNWVVDKIGRRLLRMQPETGDFA